MMGIEKLGRKGDDNRVILRITRGLSVPCPRDPDPRRDHRDAARRRLRVRRGRGVAAARRGRGRRPRRGWSRGASPGSRSRWSSGGPSSAGCGSRSTRGCSCRGGGPRCWCGRRARLRGPGPWCWTCAAAPGRWASRWRTCRRCRCTRPTSSRRRSAARAGTSRRWAVRCSRGTSTSRCPTSLRGRVDLLVANVPYVPTDDIGLMPPEARAHEPRVTLDGGADGLDVLRRVAAVAPRWLAPGGHLLVETSEAQAAAAVDAFDRGRAGGAGRRGRGVGSHGRRRDAVP